MTTRALALSSLIVVACGGNIGGGVGRGGSEAGASNAGGASNGGVSAGGAPAGGTGGGVGAGGLVGGFAGMGTGGGIDCSNVGCGAPPVCTEGCGAPCGCCPCADGDTEVVNGTTYVCGGGCYAPVAPPVDGGSPTCAFGGRVYQAGQTFRAGDGCNTCTCSGGLAACTDKACMCDPQSEVHQRAYVGTSAAACATIKFDCPANTTAFQNPCGCGCEQGVDCPDWFDCQPSPAVPPCNTTWIQAECPFSGIAF